MFIPVRTQLRIREEVGSAAASYTGQHSCYSMYERTLDV
jgi:hypothetical protein